jgi:hypothetical protein
MGRRKFGGLTMSIYRILSAIAAAALSAAVTLALPGFSPQVEAGISNPAVKTDRLDDRPLGPECAQQTWPYYRPECLRDVSRPAGEARVVRIVGIDRLPK